MVSYIAKLNGMFLILLALSGTDFIHYKFA
ncbi:uncharacterized protein METZ01_LOCUS404131, partial [marine metagenome]